MPDTGSVRGPTVVTMKCWWRGAGLATVVFACGLTAAPPAYAQTSESGTSRAASRALGVSGVKSFKKGDYAAASDQLERAYKVLRVPTLGLWSARSLAKLGKLVEAAERYLEATRLEVTTGDAAIQKKAQEDARTEREALLPRIPTLTIAVRGVDPSAIELALDGAVISNALAGQALPVNPGRHRVDARLGEATTGDEGSVEEGAAMTLNLTLTPPPQAVAGTAPARATTTPTTTTTEPPPSSEAKGGNLRKTLGFVALAVGGAALATSGITAGLALGKKKDLETDCIDNRCSPSREDDVSSYRTLRTVSTVTVFVGAAGIASGVVLLLTAPKNTESAGRTSVQPWVGLGTVGVSGRF